MTAVEKPPPPKAIPPKIRKEINGEPLVYFDHQLVGVRWLLGRRSGILADAPGLGKSVQSLTSAAVLMEAGKVKRILVICSASMQDEWRTNHIEKMTHFTCQVLQGAGKNKRENELIRFDEEGTEILVVGYSQVVAHLDTLRTMPFELIIIDEAHALKSPKAQRTKAAHKLCEALEPRVYPLTATPMLNHEGEWWSLLKLVSPNTMTWWPWKTKYMKMGGYKAKQVVGVKPNKKDELQETIDAVTIRRNVEDCVDLPELQFIRNVVRLNPTQGRLYIEIQLAMQDLKAEMAGKPDPVVQKIRAKAMVYSSRLVSLCSTAATVPVNYDRDDPDEEWHYHDDDSNKLSKVVADIAEVGERGDKAVLGSRFLRTIDCIGFRLDELDIPTFRIDGSVKQEDRHEIMQEWKLTKGAAVIMGSMPVISEGLTLTAAHDAFQVDPMYVPGHEWQFQKRIHRIGMDPLREARIHSYVTRDTIEAKIANVKERKTQAFKGTVPNHGLTDSQVFNMINEMPLFEMNEETIA